MTTLVGIVIALLAGGQVPTDTPPTGGDATMRAKVEEILTGLEKRGAGLEDITCKVIYVEEDRINLSNVEKRGWLKFLMTEPNPRWHVHFAKTIVDETIGPREWYLFDGRWLYEARFVPVMNYRLLITFAVCTSTQEKARFASSTRSTIRLHTIIPETSGIWERVGRFSWKIFPSPCPCLPVRGFHV